MVSFGGPTGANIDHKSAYGLKQSIRNTQTILTLTSRSSLATFRCSSQSRWLAGCLCWLILDSDMTMIRWMLPCHEKTVGRFGRRVQVFLFRWMQLLLKTSIAIDFDDCWLIPYVWGDWLDSRPRTLTNLCSFPQQTSIEVLDHRSFSLRADGYSMMNLLSASISSVCFE